MQLNRILSFVGLLVCLQFSSLHAQRSIRFSETNYRLKEAAKYVDMQYYQQAYYLLNDYLTHFRQDNRAMQEIDNQTALYYINLCALKLDKPHAAENFKRFLNETPFNQLKQIGNFQFAKYEYEHSQFEAAIKYYEACGIDFLTNEELTQRNFELGYSYLVTQHLDKVEPYFQSAKNIPGDYFKPGNYYHGLLAYYKKNYTEARESFNAVKDDERYKKIIPFYLTEIDYMTGEKEKALSAALEYLAASDKLYYDHELNQMVAQIYGEQEDFTNAELYYTKYMTQSKSVRDEDYFKLAYCQYQQGKIEQAIPNFELVSNSDDALSQYSGYLLAICYLKNGDKEKAYDALEKTKQKISDASQKEMLEFTMAKLSYDKGDDKTALAQLNAFSKAFPNSTNFDEANELIAFLNIKYDNFNDAVIAMNKMKNISYNLKKVYQKSNYARGIQMLKDENPELAIFNFQETKKFPIDINTVSLSDFWLAECNYRLGRYTEAFANCDLFLNKADTISMPEYTKNTHLTKAYIYFHNGENEKLFGEYAVATNDTNTTDLLSRMGTTKSNYVPEKIPVVENDPYVLVYNLPEQKIDFVYKPIPLKPLAINTEIRREDQTNFVQFGLGNYTSLDMRAGYNFDNLLMSPLYIDFNHSASTGKIVNQNVNKTHVGAYKHFDIKEHAVETSLAFDKNKQYYYGYDHTLYKYDAAHIKQVFLNIELSAHILPLKENKYNVQYHADVYTGFYTDKFGETELTAKLDASFSKQLKSDLLAHSDIVIDGNIFLKTGVRNTQLNSIISWQPSVTKQINKFSIKAGLYPTFGRKVYLLPDLLVQYPLAKDLALLELGCESKIRLNTFKQLTELNPFIGDFNNYREEQSKNTEIFAGLNGNFWKNCSYSTRAGIAVYENLPLFLNDTAFDYKQFHVLYESQATALLFDASLNYTINTEMQAGAKINLRPILNLNENKEAWHYVPSSLAFYAKFKATKDVLLSANFFLMAGSKIIKKDAVVNNPYIKTSAPGMDMNVSAKYSFNKKWNAVIDVNNLFNSHYQRWSGYPMYGINAMLSLIYSFKPIQAHL